MHPRQVQAILAAALAAACTPHARAQSINIDFDALAGQGAGIPGANFAAAAGYSSPSFVGNNWNGITVAGASAPLRDTLGVLTTATVTLTEGTGFSSNPIGLTGDFDKLITDWAVLPNSANPSIDFSGLIPGTYTVYVYVGAGDSLTTTTLPPSHTPNTQSVTSINAPVNAFFSGSGFGASQGTHTTHELVVEEAGTLRIIFPSGSFSRVAGIQLVRRGVRPPDPTGSIAFPAIDACTSGTIQIIGTVAGSGPITYTIAVSPSFAGPYTNILMGGGPLTDAPLGSWNTSTFPPGPCFMRMTVTGVGPVTNSIITTFKVSSPDSTPPTTSFSQPPPNARICTPIQISGTAADPNLTNWTLDYAGPAGGGWTSIASGNSSITGTLATWNPTGLPRGPYVLRLRASDSGSAGCTLPAGLVSESLRTVMVGLQADTTLDGSVNTLDLSWLLAQFGQSCN